MNSYFEQTGFYGQAAAAAGGDQAYRFPLGLAGMGVSPYQHQTSRQDYDATAAAAAASPKSAGLYSPLNDSAAAAAAAAVYKSPSSGGGAGTPAGNSGGSAGSGGGGSGASGGGTPTGSECNNKDQNGYSSLSKELNWSGAATAAAATTAAGGGGPVRPSVHTPPDMSRYTPGAVDAAAARDRWMNTCTGLSSSQQPQLQQAASNHTFYPWMAIAGTADLVKNAFSLLPSPSTVIKPFELSVYL